MDIMGHYGVDQSLSVYENLDKAYEAWAEDANADKPSPEAVLTGLGTVFGNRIGHKHSTSWQLITDEHGTDFLIAIKGYEIYPLDFVAKRIATLSTNEPEFGFFAGMDSVIDGWPTA